MASAKLLGASDLRLIFKHLLPNIIPTVIVFASLDLGMMMLTEGSLSFIGLAYSRRSPPGAAWLPKDVPILAPPGGSQRCRVPHSSSPWRWSTYWANSCAITSIRGWTVAAAINAALKGPWPSIPAKPETRVKASFKF